MGLLSLVASLQGRTEVSWTPHLRTSDRLSLGDVTPAHLDSPDAELSSLQLL